MFQNYQQNNIVDEIFQLLENNFNNNFLNPYGPHQYQQVNLNQFSFGVFQNQQQNNTRKTQEKQELENYKQKFDQYILKNLIQMRNIRNFLSNNIDDMSEYGNYIKMNYQEKDINFIKEEIFDQLEKLEVSLKLDDLYQSLKIAKTDNEEQKVQKFNCQLIQESFYQQNEKCDAMDFNTNSSLLIAGCEKLIKVFKLEDDKLKEIQQLDKHQNFVYCLKFMKKSNQFISASQDETIIIWEQNQNNIWECKQILDDHSSFIYCVTINKNDDLMISGSDDNLIIFWQRKNNSWSQIQQIYCGFSVFNISLSDQEDKLIANVQNYQILVIQLKGQEWKIIQNIQLDFQGLNLCFINQDQFVLQHNLSKYLQMFNFDPQDQTFKQGEQIVYDEYYQRHSNYLFPINYLQILGLILLKADQFIYILKKKQNGKFTVNQQIIFETHNFSGCISDDGKYIFTWDDKSCKIQIRKQEK